MNKTLHLQFSVRDYIPPYANVVQFFLREDDITFTLGGAYTPPITTAVDFVFPTVVVVIPPNDIRNSYSSRYQEAIIVDGQLLLEYNKATVLNVGTVMSWNIGTRITADYLIKYQSIMTIIDKSSLLTPKSFANIDYSVASRFIYYLEEIDKAYNLKYDSFENIESTYQFKYAVPKTEDIQSAFRYNHVSLQGEIRKFDLVIPPLDTSNLKFDFLRLPKHAIGAKEAFSFDLNIDPNQPIVGEMTWDSLVFDYSYVPVYVVGGKTSMQFDFSIDENLPPTVDITVKVYINGTIQPTGLSTSLPTGGAFKTNDKQTLLRHGALDELVIGAGYKLRAKHDPDTNIPPPVVKEPIVHIPYEVLQIMNTVNIKDVITNTVLDFDSFTMNRDIDSFVWTFNFVIKTETSLALVKPVGRVLKSVIININGLDIRAFVGKVNTSRAVDKKSGVVSTIYKCNAWSELRKLGDPYNNKISDTLDVDTLAGQIVIGELVGSGHTVEWETTDWVVPAGIHSYQNKTSIGAILNVVNAIGGVIVPHLSNLSFKVRPRYPVSPWNWDDVGTIPDRTMSESQFFSIDNESIPKDNPDSVYVFGNDAGTHCVRFGKNGSVPLADVVDKYISTSVAGQERGRNEVARNSFLESVPMTTYVDNNGLIMPQELIEFTAADNSVWRGMVISTNIICDRIGTAIIQKINVQRFHEDV